MEKPKVWDKHDADMPYEAIPDHFYDAEEMDAFLEFQACKLANNAHTHACLLQPVALEVAEALRGKEKEARG
jgi:hypothetical protein